MDTFIDRSEELDLINQAINALLDKEGVLRTPIIEFCGIGGIGKTALLRQVENTCRNRRLKNLWLDIGQGSTESFFTESRKLLIEGDPVVLLLDALDRASEEVLSKITIELSDLVENRNLLVVLTSRRAERFESKRTIARKISLYPLKPFDRESCDVYLDNAGAVLSVKARDAIYSWTRGYPLALKAMVTGIVNSRFSTNFDPDDPEQRRKAILDTIEKVLVGGTIPLRYHELLRLLSVPRRFNLFMMQHIIDAFLGGKFCSSDTPSVLTLLMKIDQDTNALNWDIGRHGYSVDRSIRNLFLLELRIKDPQNFYALHRFLAEMNAHLAQEVCGHDRLNYLLDFLYHVTQIKKEYDQPHFPIQQVIQMLSKESPTFLGELSGAMLRDGELQELWGSNLCAALGSRTSLLSAAALREASC
jgi:hypothetical protein